MSHFSCTSWSMIDESLDLDSDLEILEYVKYLPFFCKRVFFLV